MYFFCTYFDRHYLPRALVLYQSLRRHCPDGFRLYALCMDDAAYDDLTRRALPGFISVRLDDFERGNAAALLAAKQQRSRIEYYFTCTPCLCMWLLEGHPEIDLLTYLDADLYFFADPQPLFDELEGKSVGIVEHRFSKGARRYARYGMYNVGWVSFRRDENGLACARWWRERCLEWCFDRLDGDRFADQKYLEHWPARFAGVVVIRHKGANVAGWNIANWQVSVRDGQVWIDNQPLVFFHFASFKEIRPWLFNTSFGAYLVAPSRVVRRHVFAPYIRELRNVAPEYDLARKARVLDLHFGSLTQPARHWARFVRGIVFRQYIVFLGGRVW